MMRPGQAVPGTSSQEKEKAGAFLSMAVKHRQIPSIIVNVPLMQRPFSKWIYLVFCALMSRP